MLELKLIKATPNPFFFLNTRIGGIFKGEKFGEEYKIKLPQFVDTFYIPVDCMKIVT